LHGGFYHVSAFCFEQIIFNRRFTPGGLGNIATQNIAADDTFIRGFKTLENSSVFELHKPLSPPYFRPITNIAPETAPQISAFLHPLFSPQEILAAVPLSNP